MTRDLGRLADTRFDLVVIGAGIYGVAAAWDATERGLAVAIIDKGDFGGGTSFHNLKTVHGGLRSLQSGNLREMRQFIRERRALARIAPHLVHPLPFVIPTYRDPRRSRWVMRLALAVNDVMARDRNDGLDLGKHLPPGRVVPRKECLDLNPAIDPDGVTGGAVWHDYQMYSTDRVTLSFLLSAVERGAAAANYMAATRLVRDSDRLAGVEAVDSLGNQTVPIRASAVLNASGPWASQLAARLLGRPSPLSPKLSKALNVVTRPIAGSHALGGLAGSRFLFMVPWRNYSVIGTSHEPFDDSPEALVVRQADVDRFLAEVRRAFPRAGLGAEDVRLVHRGLLPAIPAPGAEVRLLKSSLIRDHAGDGVPRFVSLMGVRYTTARESAQQAVDLVLARLGRPLQPCRTAVTPLAGGDFQHFDTYLSERVASRPQCVSADMMRRLVFSYGSRCARVLELIAKEASQAAPLGAACVVSRAEVLYSIRCEMAVRLTDVLLRRTEAGSGGHPGTDAIEAAAGLMQAELGWSDARRLAEIAALERFYEIER